MTYKEIRARDELKKLLWFYDLTPVHRQQMEDEMQDLLPTGITREEYTERLLIWTHTAHEDVQGRLELLRSSGLI